MKLKETFSKQHLQIAQSIILVVFFLKIFYILHFTAYQSSIHNDMASYWNGAYERAWGDKFSFSQYGVCPPFYIYLCAYLLIFMKSLGLLQFALPLVIVLNVLLHSISSYFVYLIVHRLTGRKLMAFGALLFYVFSYTHLYVNALVLPDNLATPLLVIVIWIIAFGELNLFSIFGAGLLMGIAIAAKPLFVILSPVFAWHVFSRTIKKNRFVYAIVLSIGLVIIPLMTVIENNAMSKGKVVSLSPTGGVNFFQGWSQVGQVYSQGWWLYSPGAVDEIYWKSFTAQEPWYHQGYFYRLGVKAIERNPSVFLQKILWFKKLFWGVLAPALSKNLEGYDKIMPVVEWVLFIMFLCPWILCFSALRHVCDKSIYFLFSILSVFFVSIYLCGMPERRYLSYVEFLIIILFFIALDKIISLYRVYKNQIFIYFFCLASFFFVIMGNIKVTDTFICISQVGLD